MCGREAMMTQPEDVVVFIEEGYGYLRLMNAEAVSEADLIEPLRSRLTAVRMGHNMTREEKIRKLQWSLCEGKRRTFSKLLEHARSTNSMEDLSRSYGKGQLVARAGATMYITECKSVQVQQRTLETCPNDLPVIVDGRNLFADLFTYVLKLNTSGQCTKDRIPRWNVSQVWGCALPNYA